MLKAFNFSVPCFLTLFLSLGLLRGPVSLQAQENLWYQQGFGHYYSPTQFSLTDQQGRLWTAVTAFPEPGLNPIIQLTVFQANGELIFDKTWSSTGGMEVKALLLDARGDIWMGGEIQGSFATEGHELNVTPAEGKDIFLARIEPVGKVLSCQHFGGIGPQFLHDMAIDPLGNIWLGGDYLHGISVGNQQAASRGKRDVFLLHLPPRQVQPRLITFGGKGQDHVSALAADGKGNIHLTGFFEGQASFPGKNLRAQGPEDWFLAQFNAKGYLNWVHQGGNDDTHLHPSQFDQGQDLVVDPTGRVCLLGNFSGSWNTPQGHLATSGPKDQDVVILRFLPSGEALDVIQSRSTLSWEHGSHFFSLPDGNWMVNLAYSGQLNWGKESLFNPSPVLEPAWLFFGQAVEQPIMHTWPGLNGCKLASVAWQENGQVFISGTFPLHLHLGKRMLSAQSESDLFISAFQYNWPKLQTVDHKKTRQTMTPAIYPQGRNAVGLKDTKDD